MSPDNNRELNASWKKYSFHLLSTAKQYLNRGRIAGKKFVEVQKKWQFAASLVTFPVFKGQFPNSIYTEKYKYPIILCLMFLKAKSFSPCKPKNVGTRGTSCLVLCTLLQKWMTAFTAQKCNCVFGLWASTPYYFLAP